MSDEPDELPGMTRARAKELLAELSLIDLGRLVLSKAEGLQGLVHQGASVLEMSTDRSKLTVRLIEPKRKKPPRPPKSG